MQTTVYVHGDKDSLHDKGVELGLTGTALSKFQHTLTEVAITLEVDPETGDAKIKEVDGRRLTSLPF